jgi:hypothetical protein
VKSQNRGNCNPPKNETGHCVNSTPHVSKTELVAGQNNAALSAVNDKLREALVGLIGKIKAECGKGTPLHPEGHPYAIWNNHYPREFQHACEVLDWLGIRHELIEGGETFKRLWNEFRETDYATEGGAE